MGGKKSYMVRKNRWNTKKVLPMGDKKSYMVRKQIVDIENYTELITIMKR